MQKIRKILRAISEKTALPTNQPTNQPTTNQPTNQPTNYYQQHRFYRTWLTLVQQILKTVYLRKFILQNSLKPIISKNLSMRNLWSFLFAKIDSLKTLRFREFCGGTTFQNKPMQMIFFYRVVVVEPRNFSCYFTKRRLHQRRFTTIVTLDKKWSFLLRIFSVIVTKSAVFCGFGYIYW